MSRYLNVVSLALLGSALLPLGWLSAAEPDAAIPPVQQLEAKPNDKVFEATKGKEPLLIRSRDEAAKHFSKEALAELESKVDFKQQHVLIFAWMGSGQDKLTETVLESYPEQVIFKIMPGRTRDLRSHVRVYAVRSNVKWRFDAR